MNDQTGRDPAFTAEDQERIDEIRTTLRDTAASVEQTRDEMIAQIVGDREGIEDSLRARLIQERGAVMIEGFLAMVRTLQDAGYSEAGFFLLRTLLHKDKSISLTELDDLGDQLESEAKRLRKGYADLLVALTQGRPETALASQVWMSLESAVVGLADVLEQTKMLRMADMDEAAHVVLERFMEDAKNAPSPLEA